MGEIVYLHNKSHVNIMKEKSLKKNAILNSLGTVIGILFPIITFPYISRILLPEGIGRVNFVSSIISYFSLLAGLGISNYGIREAAKVRENINDFSLLVKELGIISFVSTFISYVLFFIVIFFVPKFHSYKNILFICSLNIPLATFGFSWVYSALENFTFSTINSLVFQSLNVISLFLFVKSKEDILIYVTIPVLCSIGSVICNLINLRKYISLKTTGKLKIRKHLKPIFVLFGMSVVTSIYTLLDTTMLGFLTNDTQVGYYSAATKINKLVLSVVTSACAVLFPRLSFYAEKADKTEFFNLLNKSFAITLGVAIPATIGLNLLSEPITLIFSGTEYIPSIPVMKMMNPIIIIISMSGFIGIQCLIPLRKEKITLYSVSIGAIVNFILNLLLMKKYGALGAAVSTLIAECSVTLFQIINAHKYFDKKSLIKNCIQYLLAASVMGLVVFFIMNIIKSNVAKILLSSFIGIIVYFVVLIILKNQFVSEIKKNIILKTRKKSNETI